MFSLMYPKLSIASLADKRLQMKSIELTLEDLSLYDFQVDVGEPGQVAAARLENEVNLPGVILTNKGKLFGMISRARFLERLSRPFGRELFLRRSLESLYRFASADMLLLPARTVVVEATSLALQRSPKLLHEPIVVETAPQVYRLLDVHQLLVAQCQVHQMANNLLHNLYQQLEVAHEELQRQACLDGLTQVANRRRLDEYLAQQWWQMVQLQQPMSVILADVDFFKLYNDTYGHQAGDDCLRRVARAMQESVGGGNYLVARYGGEEFCVILPNTDVGDALAIAEKIQSRVRTLNLAHAASKVSDRVTLSIGIASTIPTQDTSVELQIALADKALYKAKTNGRDRVILS